MESRLLLFPAAESAGVARATGAAQFRRARDYRVVWRCVTLLAVVQAVYAVGFIRRASVVVEGQRYFCLFDDAMISMRYADNLVRGYGLVWNPGERVEGNTNFGWTLLLALVHLVPAGASAHCLLVQILGVVMLWGCLAATAWLARATRLVPAAAIAALVLTGLYYNLMFFALMGMETGFFTALVTCGLARSVQALRSGHGAARGFLWFALAGLVRPEAVPLAAVVVVVLLCQLTRGRVLAAAGFAAVVLVQISLGFWRLHYYGQWFPNTYYLKGTGWPLTERLPVGLWQAVLTVASIALPLLLASAAIVVARRRGYGLLAVTFCFALAYEAYVGGDAWPLNRFVIPTLPAVFVLAAQGLYRLPVLLRVRRMQSAAVLRLGAVLVALATSNAAHWGRWLLVVPPQTTDANRMNMRLFVALEHLAEPDASIAVAWAGTVPYYSRRHSFDLLGKCDPHIAHLPAVPGVAVAGHNKFDLAYSVSQAPDIFLHAWIGKSPLFRYVYEPVSVSIDGVPIAFFVRKDCPRVRRVQCIRFEDAVQMLAQARELMGQEVAVHDGSRGPR